MVKIRLSRVGAKGQPYYRVVVVDERKKRDGKVLEVIGRYNPRTEPSTFEIDKLRLKYWRGVGAQTTEPVQVLLGEAKPKFHQPKNVKKEAAPVAPLVEVTPVSPTPVPAEGAGEVKLSAPETTPEPSAELAKVAASSESSSPNATGEEIAQTMENSLDIVTQETEERQPTTQEEPVAEAESVDEKASETEPTLAPHPKNQTEVSPG